MRPIYPSPRTPSHPIFRQAGIDPRGYLEVDNIDAAKRMVEQRLGIALLPRTSVQPEIGGGRLFPVTVSDMPVVRRQIVVVRRRDIGEPSGVVAAFLQTLDELVQGVTDQIGSSPDIGLPSALPKQENVGR